MKKFIYTLSILFSMAIFSCQEEEVIKLSKATILAVSATIVNGEKINISDWQRGIYLIRYYHNNQLVTHKFIVR